MIERLGADGLQFGSVSAVSTDLGNTAIFPALAGGGCLHLVPAEVTSDAGQFAAYVAEHPLDVVKITPSHLATLLDAAGAEPILPRRWLVVGGEAFTWSLAERLLELGCADPDGSGPRVLNHYGPTETTSAAVPTSCDPAVSVRHRQPCRSATRSPEPPPTCSTRSASRYRSASRGSS